MEHKAVLRFSDEVWKIIEWFTYNFDTEIGALGKMKVKKDADTGEKYFYVYELLFPQQYVSGATVHFTADMWGGLLKKHGLEGLKDVSFYWHRHPGNSAHSGTDDVDTFETFMSVEANRKHFAFLQTAIDGSGNWNEEARIDIRLPIRHTILSADIETEVDESPADEKLREECEVIAEKCIEIEPVKKCTGYAVYKNSANNYQKRLNNKSNLWNWTSLELKISPGKFFDLNAAVDKGRFGEVEGTDHFNNDFLDGIATAIEDKLSVDFEDGQATIRAGKTYQEMLEKSLKNQKSILSSYVRSYKNEVSESKTAKIYNLQPLKKKFLDMKATLMRTYFIFCDDLLRDIDKNTTTMTDVNANEEEATEKSIYDAGSQDEEVMITGKADVNNVLGVVDGFCVIDWQTDYSARVYDFNCDIEYGDLFLTSNKDKLYLKGKNLIDVLNYDVEEELDKSEEEE